MGLVDLYVANDGKPNLLWANQGDGTFRDEALTRGVALNGAGKTEAGMGVAVGDADGDGRYDLFITHFGDETNTLYTGDADSWYRDGSAASGLGAVSLPLTGWGCGFLDYDHDGDLDVALVNGRVIRGPILPGAAGSAFWQRYAEPNLGLREFREWTIRTCQRPGRCLLSTRGEHPWVGVRRYRQRWRHRPGHK